MSLVIEDGSIVVNADSYVSRSDFIAYASAVGVTVADEAATDVHLRKAFDFINSKEPNIKGRRVNRTQLGSFPRYDLWIEGFAWLSSEIPRQVINAQCELPLDLISGIDIYNPPQSESTGIKRERIEGVVDVTYAVAEGSKVSRRSLSRAHMNTFLKNGGLLSVEIGLG